MGTFLLILFILIVIWIASPIIRVWRKVRQFQNEYTRTMNQTQQQNPNQSQEGKDETMAEKYRKYSDSTAENVDFEELDGPMEDTPDTNPGNEHSTRYQEEAISDAEYEEIP